MAQVVRLMPGQSFAGDYVVERMLGQGTMGSVYLVRQTSTGQLRALKLMRPDLVTDAKAAALFAQEARLGQRIASPHVVEVVGAGVDQASGLPWLAMEYLPGSDLAEHVKARPELPPAELRVIIEQLFAALSAAHQSNVIHRDLKPENVFISPGAAGPASLGPARERGPTVKVLDFGVAKVVTGKTLQGTGSGLGTPVWAAPEQSSTKRPVRAPADVWSLGLIVFWLLVGKTYWRSVADDKASAFDVVMEIMRAPIVPASQRAGEHGAADRLPAGFDAWFARCVDRDPDARFADASAAYAALAPLLGLTPPAAAASLAAEPASGRRLVPWVLVVVGVLVASVLAGLLAARR